MEIVTTGFKERSVPPSLDAVFKLETSELLTLSGLEQRILHMHADRHSSTMCGLRESSHAFVMYCVSISQFLVDRN